MSIIATIRRQADGAAARVSPAALLTSVELLLLLGLGLAAARLAWIVVTPAGPVGDWRPVHAAAPQVDPAAIGGFDPFFRSNGADTGAARVSTLALTLLGTRVDTVSGRGSAIIGTPDGLQSSYLVSETVSPGVTLKAVAFDEVTLSTDSGDEKLFLDQSAGTSGVIAPTTPDDPQPAGDEPGPAGAAAPAGQPPRLAADIALAPRIKGSDITGFVLSPKGSGAAFAAAGLQPGDVLVSVDGAPVAGIRDPAVLAQRLDAGGVTAGIEREGRLLNLRIGGNR